MKNIFIILFLLTLSTHLPAQPAEQFVKVLVAPKHPDFLYKEGETVKFKISVLKSNIPLNNVEIRYEISEDMMPVHKSGTLTLKNGTAVVDAGAMAKAGFLRCQVTAKYKEREYKGMATAGISPGRIEPVTLLPDDFTAFWEDAKAEAAKVPMDIKMTLVPEKCTEKVNVYNVNIQSFRNNNRLYGMLTVPRGEGKYPAILKVPGAGVRGYSGDIGAANRGYIVFEIGIHGIPVNMTGDVYWNLYEGPLKNYHSCNLDNRDNYYYKRVYMGCVRAIDFIFTLPEFDGENLITYGGSQGGALSIITAGLDNRVKGLVSFYPALCDMVGFLHNRAGGWPRMFEKAEYNKPEYIRTAQYYDVVNFARQVKVPGFYTYGYNDIVCPPTSVQAALNVIDAPKEVFIIEDTGHYAYPEQRSESWNWVKNFFGK
ncbi:MAG TPA: acetylxylan esterase [Dysgonomonas sp.]|nr:acetylxylan esterase [Dysgonomonas sp.]